MLLRKSKGSKTEARRFSSRGTPVRTPRRRNRQRSFERLEDRTLLSAVRILPGFDDNTLARTDDGSAGPVDIGFEFNYFGNSHDELFVNNNGNVTFDEAFGAFTPEELSGTVEIIAPFWGDVSTLDENHGVVTYGTDMVDGREAFAVNWIDVPFSQAIPGPAITALEEIGNGDEVLTNSFQLVVSTAPPLPLPTTLKAWSNGG